MFVLCLKGMQQHFGARTYAYRQPHKLRAKECCTFNYTCLLQVPEDIFICASTGRCYPISQSPYLGVESMWNHNNYWVCMQMPEPHSDSRAIPKQLSLDFTDASKWEYVLPNAAPQVHLLLGSCDSCCCCCCCCCSNGMTVRTAVLVQKLE